MRNFQLNLRLFVAALTVCLCTGLTVFAQDMAAAEPALEGLDPVQLVQGKEVQGNFKITVTRGRFQYMFANEEDKALFEKDPAHYEIQLNGSCARMGAPVGGNPDLYSVHKGRIYIFGSPQCKKLFDATPEKYLEDDGAAKAAGLQKGDFVTKINDVTINSSSELQEQVARYKPGDKVAVTYVRDGKEKVADITMKNKSGTYEVVKNETSFDGIGATLVTIDKATAQKNDISGGVQVQKIDPKGLLKNTRIQEGFIITSVDGQDVNSVDDLKNVLNNSDGTVRLEGVYPGYDGTYGYPLALNSDSGNNNNSNP